MNLADPTYMTLHRHTTALSVALSYRDPYTRLHWDRVVEITESGAFNALGF